MSYAFIRDHVAAFPVQVMCEVLGVSRGGYYAWASRPESARAVEERDYLTRDQARADVFQFLEGWYNRCRLHSALGYLTPEQKLAAFQAAASGLSGISCGTAMIRWW